MFPQFTSFRKTTAFFLLVFILSGFLAACGSDGDSGGSKAKVRMCYETHYDIAPPVMYLLCQGEEHYCEDGRAYLAAYKNWDDCYDDQDIVQSNWSSSGYGTPQPGPKSLEVTEGFGSSSGGGGGSGTGDSYDCNSVWTGSPGDHAQYTCMGACAEYNFGNTAGVNANCGILAGYGAATKNSCKVC